MKIKNRQQFLLIIAAAAVAIFVGDRVFLTPLTRLWKDRTARVTALERAVTGGRQLLEREEAIRTRWGHMQTNSLPPDMSTAENKVLQAFDRWSKNTRVSITAIKPEWKRGADDYIELACQADAYGDIESLTRFLYEVENDPLALKVAGVELTARDKEGRQLTLALRVSGLLLPAAQP